MMMPELNGMPPGLSSMMEKQPQMRLSMQACLKAATSGPSSVHMISRIDVHRQAVQRVFRKHHQIHRAEIAPRLADHGDDFLGLRGEVGPGDHIRQLQLHQPDDDAVARFC